MLTVIEVVLPVFGLILCGYLLDRWGILNAGYSEAFNRIVYFAAFPALLFVVVARTPPDLILNWPFLGAWTASIVIVYALMGALSAILYRDGLGNLGMRGMNVTCSSTAFMGIPLCVAAFGRDAALPAVLATTVLAIVDISLTVLLIEAERNPQARRLLILRNIAISLAKNPLMIAVTLGGLVAFSGLTLPVSMVRFCEILGGAAIPLSLVTLGLFIANQSLTERIGEVSVLSLVKLVVHPLVAWLVIRAWFPMDATWTAVTVLLAALPPATTCFVIAQRYNTHLQQTSVLMVASTVLSVLSVSVVLLLFQAGP